MPQVKYSEMIKQPHSKIALVGDMLGEGGAERVQARLSIYFEKQGVEVHHIIVRDIVTYKYAGTLFNMGKLKNKSIRKMIQSSQG